VSGRRRGRSKPFGRIAKENCLNPRWVMHNFFNLGDGFIFEWFHPHFVIGMFKPQRIASNTVKQLNDWQDEINKKKENKITWRN
jgi:hypothetical protein